MLFALTPVCVNPQRGQPGSTAGGLLTSAVVLSSAVAVSCDGDAAGSAGAAVPQLATASVRALMPAAKAVARRRRRQIDPPRLEATPTLTRSSTVACRL
ncbi:hypothetical protein GCM10022419_071800 [Nonomuraea rosea]|uniref:Secreted protein n=1 Tax=Nonomuraea rosea TaxID=638574 RepID=A0ABP6YAK5_9ACTN